MQTADSGQLKDLEAKAIEHFNSGNLAEARDAAQKIAAIDPANLHANFINGQYCTAAGDLEGAIRHLEAAVSANSKFIEAKNSLGLAYMNKGRTGDAEGVFLSVIKQQPKYLHARLNLGMLLINSKRPKEAMVHLDFALNVNSELADAHFLRGEGLRLLGQYDQAIFAYKRALIANPEHFEAHFNTARLLQLTGHYHDALMSFREAQRLQPDNLLVSRHLGKILQELGHHAEGLEISGRATGYLEFYLTGNSPFKLTGRASAKLEFNSEAGSNFEVVPGR